MKLICVTQRLIYDKNSKTYKDGLDKDLLIFLNKIGYLPIPIPNLKLKKDEIKKLLYFYINKLNIRGFILSGGEDLNQNRERYQIEKEIYKICSKKKIPLFGICRGLQMLAHLNKVKLVKVFDHVAKRHAIISNLKNKSKRKVNSFHNWQIYQCPKNYITTYVSDDKVIEGIRHKKLPISAIMWHPEREKKYHQNDIKTLKKLFK